MNLKRFFSSDSAKGSIGYIKSQRKIELIKTIILFAVSISLFASGVITTGTKRNLLTIVAVLGCLPASKALVNTIMFFRFKGCAEAVIGKLLPAIKPYLLYDLVFTTYEKNFEIDALYVGSNEIIGFSDKKTFANNEKAFYEYITKSLANDGIKGMTIKIFKDIDKFNDRLSGISPDNETPLNIVASILNVVL